MNGQTNKRLELLEKLHEYSKETKKYWLNQRAGNGRLKILECYGDFPENTDFKYPSFVPKNVQWSRFRFTSSVRLIGFFISNSDICCNQSLSPDIFYIVFLDRDHKFYKMEKR